MDKFKWWHKPSRIIQTNLTVTDADLDPAALAQQLEEMNATGLVINGGGIYAWYPTQIPYHTVNPFLREGFDLLGEVVEACHRRHIRVIARCDFSKATDTTYLEKPEWFIRLPASEGHRPQIVGVERPGNWPLLMSTCPNAGYQREAVAFPVLEELLTRYVLDGIFINSMFYAPCQCDVCKGLYRERYGCELPESPADCEPDWFDYNINRSLAANKAVMRRVNPAAAFFHRYMLWEEKLTAKQDAAALYHQTGWWFPSPGDYDVFYDDPPDVLHAETHDSLSNGATSLGHSWTPAANTNLGLFLDPNVQPVDIVHTAPGLLWRHVGLPPAEHRFWLSQVLANGGNIWHSLSGLPDRQRDRRLVRTISEFNKQAEISAGLMKGATNAAQIAILWNHYAGHGWIEILTGNQIPYQILVNNPSHIDAETLRRYRIVILPENTRWTPELTTLCASYVEQGGCLMLEGGEETPPELTGAQVIGHSEEMRTAYFRMESQCPRDGLEGMDILPFAGRLYYTRPEADVETLCTLVPPFSPPMGAGSPPERAVLPVERTEIPVVTLRRHGMGNVIHLPFAMHHLVDVYRLEEHYRFAANLFFRLLGDNRKFVLDRIPGVQFTAFEGNGCYLFHLVNGVGERPMRQTVPLTGLSLHVSLPAGAKDIKARSVFGNRQVPCRQVDGQTILSFDLPDTWEIIQLEWNDAQEK